MEYMESKMQDLIEGGIQQAAEQTPFEEWWKRKGEYMETQMIPSTYRIAKAAFEAAMAQSRNYTVDDPEHPTIITFANGRKVVSRNGEPFLLQPQ